jgi:hypothetical protein
MSSSLLIGQSTWTICYNRLDTTPIVVLGLPKVVIDSPDVSNSLLLIKKKLDEAGYIANSIDTSFFCKRHILCDTVCRRGIKVHTNCR